MQRDFAVAALDFGFPVRALVRVVDESRISAEDDRGCVGVTGL